MENLPVIVEGRTVAWAIINHDRKQAMDSAEAAAYHVSTPNDVRFCTFSDGSCSNDSRHWGGVGLVYRRQWLPREWDPEHKAAGGDTVEKTWPFGLAGMVQKAWPFGHAVQAVAMEGVGVLESLHAANEELKRSLPTLKQHASTVTVTATTDCQEILRYISKATLEAHQAKRLPPRLVKEMHALILELQGHGIEVVVEMRWCQRNCVPQLGTADAIAGKAMKTGLGYCNVTQSLWSEATQSAVMKRVEPMLAGIIRVARLPPSQTSTGTGTVTTEKETTKKKTVKKETTKATTKETTDGTTKKATKKATKKETTKETTTKETTTRRGKKEKKRAQAATMKSTGIADSQPQFTLPEAPLPSKPLSAKPTTPKPMQSNPAPMEQETTLSDGATTIPSTEPTAAAPPGTQSPEVQAGKRKAEENMEESEGRPTKKSKPSPDSPTQEQQPPRMPAAREMDPRTMVCIADPETGLSNETPIAREMDPRTMVCIADPETGLSNETPIARVLSASPSQRVLPDKAKIEGVESVGTREVVPRKTIPQEAIPQEVIPQEAIPQEAIQQAGSPRAGSPQDGVLQESHPQEDDLQEAIPQQVVLLDDVPQKNVV